MNEKNSSPLFGIGGVTLLTVLLILCLTLFSVMALSSSQADLRLSEKNAKNVEAYYHAENEVYVIMQQAEWLWPAGKQRPSLEAFDEVLGNLPDEYLFSAEMLGSNMLLSASIPVLDGSNLQVELLIQAAGNGQRWEVRQWQLMPPSQNEADIAFLSLWIPQF